MLIRIALALLLSIPSWAAIALVGTPAQGGGAGTGTTVISAAASTTTGNLLIVLLRTQGVAITSIADTSLDSFTLIFGGGVAGTQVWYAKNITGNAANIVTVVLTTTSTFRSIIVSQYSGLDTTSPLDQFQNVGSASPATTASFTTTVANELLWGGLNSINIGVTCTAGSGYTIELTDSQGIMCVQDKIVSSIQTGITTSISWTGGSTGDLAVATFKGAATTTPVKHRVVAAQ